VDETKTVEQRPIRGDPRAGFGLDRKLRNELPFISAAFVDESRAIFEQRLKCGPYGGLVSDAELRELVKRRPISRDFSYGWRSG
jgi:hypothetical protein